MWALLLLFTNLIQQNVKCLRATAVRVPKQSPDFHANFVHLRQSPNVFISCEAPTSESVKAFFNLIFHEGVEMIIMLCNWVERKKEKAFPYFQDRDILNLGSYRILVVNTGHDQMKNQHFRQRELSVTHKNGKSRKIIHIHWNDWQDMSVPTPNQFHIVDHLIEKVNSQKMPVIVHCSAGVGRSGSFIMAHTAWHLLKTDPKQLGDLKKLMRELRKQRCQSVQNYYQLYFVAAFIVSHIMTDFSHMNKHLCEKFLNRFIQALESNMAIKAGELGNRQIKALLIAGKLPRNEFSTEALLTSEGTGGHRDSFTGFKNENTNDGSLYGLNDDGTTTKSFESEEAKRSIEEQSKRFIFPTALPTLTSDFTTTKTTEKTMDKSIEQKSPDKSVYTTNEKKQVQKTQLTKKSKVAPSAKPSPSKRGSIAKPIGSLFESLPVVTTQSTSSRRMKEDWSITWE